MELMEKVRDHVEALGVTVEEVVEIQHLDLQPEVKRITTEEGEVSAPAVILATGRRPRRLAVDTDCEQVHYCAICDGSAYRGKNVVVVGGGNSGVDESLYLLSLGVNRLVLVEEFDRLLASESACRRLCACGNVEILTATRVSGLHGEGRLAAVTLQCKGDQTTVERPADGVFVYIGQDPQTELFRGQIELDAAGYIPVDAEMRTSAPGVFAAGDVIQKKYRQITTAMGDATVAALSAVGHLSARRECLA
jgi:thioredoxin reductase (NADPH)